LNEYATEMIRPGRVRLELRRHSPRRSSGVLRTFVYGLGRKVAPDFCQSFHSLAKICHAFRARTFVYFVPCGAMVETHANKSACTRFTRPYTLRGAKVPRSLLSFMCAFVPSGSPRNPARQPGRTRMHFSHRFIESSAFQRTRVTLDCFAFARVIPAFPSVRRISFAQVENSLRAIPLVKPGRPMQQHTIL
jgi:hypothetical protein